MHIPFCDSKCPYCAFNSYDNKRDLKQKYILALLEQTRFELEKFNAKKASIDSLFIGGGTPSTIQASWYEPFFNLIKPYLKANAEITSEANPNSATKAWLQEMGELGINRISFGVQSFDTKKLAFLGRNHSAKTAIEAVENASIVGIASLSVDLIYGTALDTMALLEGDLQIARSLPINHLSAYALTIEENTPFFHKKRMTNESETLAKNFVSSIIDAGFPHYEISNFGTYQSIHNKGYWQQKNYMGIGSGAVGFLNNKRYYPSKALDTYLLNPCAQEVEVLSAEDLHVEKIFLGLRSNVGIDLSSLHAKERERVDLLIHEKKLTCKDERIYNNDYFLSDEIALFMTQ